MVTNPESEEPVTTPEPMELPDGGVGLAALLDQVVPVLELIEAHPNFPKPRRLARDCQEFRGLLFTGSPSDVPVFVSPVVADALSELLANVAGVLASVDGLPEDVDQSVHVLMATAATQRHMVELYLEDLGEGWWSTNEPNQNPPDAP